MPIPHRRHRIALALTLLAHPATPSLLLAAMAGAVRAQGPLTTAFTYQGEVRNASGPVTSASADFKFRLYAGPSGGSPIVPEVDLNAVPLLAGRFAVSLDFGGVFAGQSRFVEIEARSPAGSGAFALLTPRQPLTAAPYALYALSGNPGPQGSTGPQGSPGAQGAQGSPGVQGAQGERGLREVKVRRRAPGAQGSPGAQGAQGSPGVQGAQGANGVQGVQGVPGATGAQGSPGAQGAQGAQGGQGAQGVNGAQGATGASPWLLNGNTTYYNAGFVGVGRNAPVTGAEAFGIRSTGTGYGGMYIQTPAATGMPFYGYTNTGGATAWTYLDGSDGNKWKLYQNGADRLVVTSAGNVGIGTLAPSNPLSVAGSIDITGSIGIGTPTPVNRLSVVGNSDFGGDVDVDSAGTNNGSSSNAVLRFGGPSAAISAEVIGSKRTAGGNQFGLDFYTNAAARMSITNAGNIGIGTTVPQWAVDIHSASNPIALSSETDSNNGIGVYGRCTQPAGYGVYGFGSGNGGGVGVYGGTTALVPQTGVAYAVWAHPGAGAIAGEFDGPTNVIGVFTVTGAKLFRIDHPDDPENKYLQHYCAEGPEALNQYSGTVRLDGSGSALIELPSYFAKINKDPRYTLTAVGAAMPMLHIAEEISDDALASGGACSFLIAGGAPGRKVSWEVKAVRNDAWMRNHGMPVEAEKPESEKGTYLYPEGFGKPESLGVNYARHAALEASLNAAPSKSAPSDH